MFPTIFTLTLERSTAPVSATSGLLCSAIVGGAVLPLIGGQVADASTTFNPVFFVPLVGYAAAGGFCRRGQPGQGQQADVVAAPGAALSHVADMKRAGREARPFCCPRSGI